MMKRKKPKQTPAEKKAEFEAKIKLLYAVPYQPKKLLANNRPLSHFTTYRAQVGHILTVKNPNFIIKFLRFLPV